MKKAIKLLILIIISLSVYFIYQQTKNDNKKVLCIGDGLSLGINSYGIKDYGYIDYYKDYLQERTEELTVIKEYSNKGLSIKELLQNIKTNNKLKRDLMESHILFLTVGYNDLLYKFSLEDNMDTQKFDKIIRGIKTDYLNLIKEIKKYYKNEIIVIGYYKSYKDDYYMNMGISKLNKIIRLNEDVTYLDTYQLLSNHSKYFSNNDSYYPNRLGYEAIANKIIENTWKSTKYLLY